MSFYRLYTDVEAVSNLMGSLAFGNKLEDFPFSAREQLKICRFQRGGQWPAVVFQELGYLMAKIGFISYHHPDRLS